MIWTKYLSPDYALFIALAIIDQEKEQLNQPTHDFSDILQVGKGMIYSLIFFILTELHTCMYMYMV